MQKMAHADGEVATSKAAADLNITMGLSSFATTSLEEVASHRKENDLVLQLYIFEERHHSEKLIKRAKAAGYKAVFLTVDTPILGRRLNDKRNKFKMPPHLRIANFVESGDSAENAEADAVMNGSTGVSPQSVKQMQDSKGKDIAFHTHAANASLCWEQDIGWLKKICGPEMQVWVKGIATGEDAALAIQYGCDGICVSNHGGKLSRLAMRAELIRF